MRLKRYHCQNFALRFTTDKKNFDERQFFSDPRTSDFFSNWTAGEPLYLTHYTKEPKASDYHAHLRLQLRKGIIRIEILWFVGTVRKKKGSRYPFAEDVLHWIDGFYAKIRYEVRISVDYSFPPFGYAPLPFLAIPFLGRRPGREPIKLVGVTVSAELPRALRARTHVEVLDDNSLWVMIKAWYRSGLSRLGPERLLPEFEESLSKQIFL